MGSATRQALAQVRAELTAQGGASDLATGENLFQAARAIGRSHQLIAALADAGAEAGAKTALVHGVFGASLTPAALAVLDSIASDHWSNAADLLAAIEEIGLRVVAASAPERVSVDEELFAFGRAVNSDSELELALTSKLGADEAKVSLLDSLLNGKASDQTRVILSHLVQQPRGRRIGELLRYAEGIVADEAGYSVATVTAATELAPAQLERLATGLSARYERRLRINQIVDPTVLGGLRVQVGDDVIDGSISKRLGDLRLQLAG